MQYDQTFYNQLCTDNRARHIRVICAGPELTLRAISLDVTDQTQHFETDLYLDEQDREALAVALHPRRLGPALHWSEIFAMGLTAGILFGFVCGALI